MSLETVTGSGISRRAVIGFTPALAAATLVAGLETAQADGRRQVLAFITDTHADPENALHLARLEATFRAIEAEDPLMVLNGGDITEYGDEATFRSYLDRIPTSLREKMVHTLGNHESRWDPSAYEVYERLFGARNVSLTVAGIQIISMDPTMPQQEIAYYTQEDLAWLDRELKRGRGNQPTILMVHFPQGEGHYYTVNQEDFLEVIEGRGVHLMLSGHIHQVARHHFNGVTHVHIGANRVQSQFLRVVIEGGRDATMVLEHVAIPDHTAWHNQVVTQLGSASLSVARGTDRLKPRSIKIDSTRSTLSLSLVHPHASPSTTIRAAIYDQANYGRVSTDTWHRFVKSRGKTWSVDIDVSGLAPGEHRARINVEEGERRWREIVAFTVPAPRFAPTDARDVDGLIHGGLVALGGRVVVPTAAGVIHAYDVAGGDLRRAWSTPVGPVWTSLALEPALRLVVAASSDHRVRALSLDSGAVVWERDLGRPVMSDPLVTDIGGRAGVVVVADQQLALLDAATGALRWTREVAGMSAGRAAADDDRIYVGLGDGRAWAFAVADGSEVWSRDLSGRDETYRRRIYGPWNTHVKLVSDDLVIVSTVTGASAMDRATGEPVWSLPQSYLYTPIVELADADLIMVDEWGDMRRVHPETGAVEWHTPAVVPRSLEAAPVVVGDLVYLVGVTGMLGVVDAGTGQVVGRRQLMANNVFSTPVAAGGSLVVGHMPGVVRAYPLGG